MRQLFQGAEVLVVAVAFAGKNGVQRVMKIVAPLRVQPVTAGGGRAHDTRVVEIALGDEMERPALALSAVSGGFGQFRQDVAGAEIVDGVNRIQPQRVAMAGFEPVTGVTDHVLADTGAVRAVVVDGIAPRGAVVIGEIGSQPPQIIPLGAKVVVNHVHDHRQTFAVAGIDQALQALDPAVGMLRRPGIDAVVTPVAITGKLGDRQQFQGIDPQFPQFGQARDDGVESPFGSEGSDMQFVHHPLRQRRRPPTGVGPGESVVHDSRWAVHALRLAVGDGIRTVGFPVPAIKVKRAGFDAGDGGMPVTALVAGHGNQPILGRNQMDGGLFQQGRP